MPKRTDISSILIIGSGPIVIGQACEFDYSGAQACKALRQEGYRVVLVNSNPATIMTDPEMADATYIEPLTVEMLEKIIALERPDALLPTVGGQTGLNLSIALAEAGILDKYGVELIGANQRAMKVAEDRELFKNAMTAVGLESPRSGVAHSLEEARKIARELGRYPIFIRPSFTLGGSGAGTVFTPSEFDEKVAWGLKESPVHTVLIEESLIGWKEYELEVMRDKADNFVVVCSIENLDAMGVHTGDSITVAPAQTLTDKEYQRLRDQARLVMRAVGVETGGSNVQFAVDPMSGRVVIIEMNPRVSRSSALASKATGFPIAKLAAKVAVGYTLDELKNDITQQTVAAFEPSIDYVVVKIPRWAFEKFPGVDRELGPQMKSVGEVMAIGRTFKEALQKGVRSLEISRDGLSPLERDSEGHIKGYEAATTVRDLLRVPNRDRLFAVYEALQKGESESLICQLTGYDPWFVAQMKEIANFEANLTALDKDSLRRAKRMGFSDSQLARIANKKGIKRVGDQEIDEDETSISQSPTLPISELDIRKLRQQDQLLPTYHQVDTCAAEFEAMTPYLYSSYETSSEAQPTDRQKVLILGGGPNRIGQGIEFDYCCVHASYALRELGYETIMVNCNPETVSTDYDTSDRLYFEPLTLEDVLNIFERENGRQEDKKTRAQGEVESAEDSDNPQSAILNPKSKVLGAIVQFGGQTPLNLANKLHNAGIPILGTSPEAIDLAEDRDLFGTLLDRLNIPAPAHGSARNADEAVAVAEQIGYPIVVRPSYVLGGRAMAIVDDESALRRYMTEAVNVSGDRPILIDQFLEDAFEIDVDAIADKERVVIGGIMQHIEEAGIHSGDSACVLPPYKISQYHLTLIRQYTEKMARALGVLGLMNVQYAIKDDVVYVLEVNPRASRTVPFVSKATGVPLAKIAAKVMAGKTLSELGLTNEPVVDGFFVKEAVLPWKKFTGIDTLLGPEMRSTGEVMGHASRFGHAFAKSQLGAGAGLPDRGGVLVTVNDYDKGEALKIARDLNRLGFTIYATAGTGEFFSRTGLPVTVLGKATSDDNTLLDAMRAGSIQMIINTPLGQNSREDGVKIRQLATRMEIPLITTLSAAQAAVNGIRAVRQKELDVRSLQDHYGVQKR
ncbi:MAG: carbamoyl-phosphate synthase large subunit [Caldilineaceae bacterium]